MYSEMGGHTFSHFVCCKEKLYPKQRTKRVGYRFISESGVYLGISKDSILLLKDKQMKITKNKNVEILTYSIYKHRILKEDGMPAYTELKDRATRIKAYVKAAYGTQSEEYALVKGLSI